MKLTNPLTQLTQNTEQLHTSTAYHQQIKVNQVMKPAKKSYQEYWNDLTKTQNRLDCYRALKTDYKLAEYLFSVRDTKQRQILTKYRLSDHRLAIEKGRHRNTWLPKEQRTVEAIII